MEQILAIKPGRKPNKEDGNLMHQSSQINAGKELTKDQIIEIKNNYEAPGLNQGKQN